MAHKGGIEVSIEYLVAKVNCTNFLLKYLDVKFIFFLKLKLKGAEIGSSLAAVSPERWLLVDFTAPIVTVQYSIIQPMPTEQNKYFVPIKPFQPLVIIEFKNHN